MSRSARTSGIVIIDPHGRRLGVPPGSCEVDEQPPPEGGCKISWVQHGVRHIMRIPDKQYVDAVRTGILVID